MILNFDCFRDTLRYIIEVLSVNEETKEMKPLSIPTIYKSDDLSEYSEVDIYYSLCCLADIGYIDMDERPLKHKRLLISVKKVTMLGHNFYFGTDELPTWETLKTKAQTLDGMALEYINDTIQKYAVTTTAIAATDVINKSVD